MNCSCDLKKIQILSLQPQKFFMIPKTFFFSQQVSTILETKYQSDVFLWKI